MKYRGEMKRGEFSSSRVLNTFSVGVKPFLNVHLILHNIIL